MANAERTSARRRFILILMASAFLIWQVPAMDWFANLIGDEKSVLDIVALVGGLAWIAAVIFFLATGFPLLRKTNPDTKAVLEDELVRDNRRRAFVVGYWAMLVVAAATFVLSLYVPSTGADSAHLVIVAGVVVPIYAFVLLDRFHA